MVRRTAGFLADLHAFRGVAILNIVAAHIWSGYYNGAGPDVVWGRMHQMQMRFHEILWHDSTLYFTLISGLLFSRILASRGWLEFLKSKALHVLLPYAVMSIAYTLISFGVGVYGDRFSINYYGLKEFIVRYLNNLWQGDAVFVYWYIPVLACLYALTPLVYWIAKRSFWVIVLVAIVPLFISRTGTELSIGTIVYFLVTYTIGIYFGIDYEN